MLLKQVLIGDEKMRVLKNLFGDNSKIHSDNIVVGTAGSNRSLSDSVIAESGSNANGKYIKYADGTMICYAKFSGTPSPAVSIQFITWTFPKEFIDANVSVSGSFFCIQSGVAFRNGILLSNTSPSTKTSCNFTGIDFNQSLFNSWMCDLIAIGRWK